MTYRVPDHSRERQIQTMTERKTLLLMEVVGTLTLFGVSTWRLLPAKTIKRKSVLFGTSIRDDVF
jgi:hypothetical protein